MSKQIDLTKPLSDEDRQYLEDRARHYEIAANDAEHAGAELPPEYLGLTGGEPAFGVPADSHPEGVGLGEGTLRPTNPHATVADESAPTEEDSEDSYDDMTVAELQDELENRELPKSGKKAELIARLRGDDGGEESE